MRTSDFCAIEVGLVVSTLPQIINVILHGELQLLEGEQIEISREDLIFDLVYFQQSSILCVAKKIL